MATTYTLINSNVLSSEAAAVTFSSIPSTYTDLVVRASLRFSSTYSPGIIAAYRVYINGDTTTNYSYTSLFANSSSASSQRNNVGDYAFAYTQSANGSSSTANTFTSAEFYLPNYKSSTVKPFSAFNTAENNSAASGEFMIATMADLYQGTSAITSIGLDGGGRNWAVGSSFYLYGISNA